MQEITGSAEDKFRALERAGVITCKNSAKCKDAGISHLTINIRLELEKIREQAQNIE